MKWSGAARDLEPPLLYARWTEEFRGGKVLSRVRPTSQKNAVVVFSGRAFNGHVQRSVPISNATKNGPRFRNWLDPRSLILNHGPISPVRLFFDESFIASARTEPTNFSWIRGRIRDDPEIDRGRNLKII